MLTAVELALGAACALSLAAAVTDTRSGMIPNGITLPGLGLGLGLGALDGGAGLGAALLGAALSFIAPYVVFRGSRGVAIGGGDVKLFAALGALLGPRRGLEVELAALGLLVGFSVLVLGWRGQLLTTLARAFWLSLGRALPRRWRRPAPDDSLLALRMGPAICLATWGAALLAAWPLGQWPLGVLPLGVLPLGAP